MIAAGRVAEDAISRKIMDATAMRPKQAPLTLGQRKAWDNLIKEFGEEARCLEWPSAREAAEAAVLAMTQEAEKLMSNPAVCKAYEHFQLICTLTKEQHNG
jgi:hypothetical protein